MKRYKAIPKNVNSTLCQAASKFFIAGPSKRYIGVNPATTAAYPSKKFFESLLMYYDGERTERKNI